jgi:hypothetical protein
MQKGKPKMSDEGFAWGSAEVTKQDEAAVFKLVSVMMDVLARRTVDEHWQPAGYVDKVQASIEGCEGDPRKLMAVARTMPCRTVQFDEFLDAADHLLNLDRKPS